MNKQEREQKSGDEPFHARSVEEVLGQLDVTAGQGLAEGGVRKRREHYGLNELEEEAIPSLYLILLNQFKSIVILIMAAAALVASLPPTVLGAFLPGIYFYSAKKMHTAKQENPGVG